MCRTFAKSVVLVFLSALSLHIPSREASPRAPFADKNLETAVRDVLREPKADLTDDKLKNVYVLEVDGKGHPRPDRPGEVQEPGPAQTLSITKSPISNPSRTSPTSSPSTFPRTRSRMSLPWQRLRNFNTWNCRTTRLARSTT